MTLPLGNSYGYDASNGPTWNAYFILSLAQNLILLISGRGRGRMFIRGWLWGRGNLSLSLSCKEKTLLCPHQTSCGKPLGLPILHHTSANSMLIGFSPHTSILPLKHCLLAMWIIMYFLSGVYLKVIPAKSSSTIHVSFTPLTLSESVCESRCVGLALGFMSLDSEVTCSIH